MTSGFSERGRTSHVAWARTGPRADVLFLHGFSDSGDCWSPLVPSLADRWGLLALDARGHGESGLPEEMGGRTAQAGDAALVIEKAAGVRPGGVVVVGHSMGAVTAAALAESRPDLVRAVVLEDPPPFARVTTPDGPPPLREMPDWLRDARALDPATRIEHCRAGNADWPDDEFEPWSIAKDQLNPHMFDLPSEPTAPLPDVLAQISRPVLLLHGDTERGSLVSAEMAATCAKSAAGEFEAVHIAGAGHSVRRDRRAPYLTALSAFLDRHV